MFQRVELESPQIEFFRRQVLRDDFGVNPDHVDQLKFRRQFEVFPTHHQEDLYKFSGHKWKSSKFERFYGFFEEDRLISLCGCRSYGRYLRIGMNYYTLKTYRKQVRSPLWVRGGFCDLAIRDLSQEHAMFISIYGHNSRLRSWIEKLKRGRSLGQLANPHASAIDGIRRFEVLETEIEFHKVPQTILFLPISDQFDLHELISTIEGMNS